MVREWPADWDDRMRGVGCGMCSEGRPGELKGGSRIFAGEVSDAYLRREAWVRGYSVVIWRGAHTSELHELSPVNLARYWSEVTRVGGALRDHFRPAKLNYQVLGNTLPHVHTHIVPRYLDDAAPGRPLPFPEPRLPDQPEEPFQRDVASLRLLLEHETTESDERAQASTATLPGTAMTHALGAASVIVDASRHVLLVKHNYGRRNWEIPGGISEAGESAEETALREAREELGVALVLEKLTGVYWEPDWRDRGGHHFVFLARLADGSAPQVTDRNEIADLGWSPFEDLPRPISDFTVQRIKDALDGGSPLIRTIRSRTWIE